jgi:hypothetical protein
LVCLLVPVDSNMSGYPFDLHVVRWRGEIETVDFVEDPLALIDILAWLATAWPVAI